MRATHRRRCSECDQWIKKGDPISKAVYGYGHPRCVQQFWKLWRGAK